MADALATSAASAGVAATGITIASFFPGLHLDTVVGSFGGALFFVLFAKNISLTQRMGYLVVGWIGGYLASSETAILNWFTPGVASFIGGVLCVTICISLLEAFQTGKPPKWLTWILERVFGKRTPE